MSDPKPAKLPPLPLVLTANDLLEGHVVYWTGSAWSPMIGDALLAEDREAAEALLALVPGSEAKVIDVYLAPVKAGADGVPVPTHYREQFRVSGPTYDREGAL